MRRGGQYTSSLRPSSSRDLESSRTPVVRRAILAAAAVAALGGAFAPRASADTWDGGGADPNWTPNANWLDDTAPVPPEALIFAGSPRLTSNNDYAANTLFNGIAFDAAA